MEGLTALGTIRITNIEISTAMPVFRRATPKITTRSSQTKTKQEVQAIPTLSTEISEVRSKVKYNISLVFTFFYLFMIQNLISIVECTYFETVFNNTNDIYTELHD
jgi:hypothetical protein